MSSNMQHQDAYYFYNDIYLDINSYGASAHKAWLQLKSLGLVFVNYPQIFDTYSVFRGTGIEHRPVLFTRE
jgi:hypothetical protein